MSFNSDAPPSATAAPPERAPAAHLLENEALDLVGVSSAREETAYNWDIGSDRLVWEDNVRNVLGIAAQAPIDTGSGYNALISAEHVADRTGILKLPGGGPRGTQYRVYYRLLTGGRRSGSVVHVEDEGRWWAGPDGQPARARGVVRVLHEHYLEQQRALFRSDLDELTGQLNRIRLTEALGAAITRAEDGMTSTFMVIAINNVAVINETFGFEVGDEAIAAVGRRIKDKLRGGDVVGRYASNKFGVVMMDCGAGAAEIAAERFIKAVREAPLDLDGSRLSVTISIGGVVVPEQAKTVQEALTHALRALDRARSTRLDCFMMHEPQSSAELERRRSRMIADEVMSAIDDRRMRLALQPMVCPRSGKTGIYECLLRMERADGSIVAAGEFVPVAEKLGLSRLIDRRTLELSVELLERHPGLVLSLNVSGLTCTDREWLAALRRLTGDRPDLLRRMIVEITETAALQDIDQSAAFVDTLKELGCRVAIDDFGAGYTSFKNLKLLNVDIVKIDGAFVKNLADDTSDQIFLKTLVELARSFRLDTVAEWVGDERAARHLAEVGVTYMQGYYSGRPFDAADLPQLPAPLAAAQVVAGKSSAQTESVA